MRVRRIGPLLPPARVHPIELYGPEKARGTEPIKPPPPKATPEELAALSEHANQRKKEEDLQNTARQAELQQPGSETTDLQKLLASARRAGLTPGEITKLRVRMGELSTKRLAEEISFLRGQILRKGNSAEGLRAYIELTATPNPERMSASFLRSLTRAVSENRGTAKSATPYLKRKEASEVARALAGMTSDDYQHAHRLLANILSDRDALLDQQALQELSEILKGIARRCNSLVNPAINDLFRNMVGLPGYFLSEVIAEAEKHLEKTAKTFPAGAFDAGPPLYLKDGFLTPDHQLGSGIKDFYAEVMARRLVTEEVTSETIRDFVDILCRIGEDLIEVEGEDPDLPLDESVQASLKAFFEMEEVHRSFSLFELLEASQPWLRNLRDLAAFTVHVECILRQVEELKHRP